MLGKNFYIVIDVRVKKQRQDFLQICTEKRHLVVVIFIGIF